jgi:FtsZ-binding cell division protein ZapB
LRGDVDTARENEKHMSDAFEMLNAEMRKSKATWKCIQTLLVVDVECAHEENVKLTQTMASQNVEMEKINKERDAAGRCHRQAQEELGPLRMELPVVVKDLKKARAN